MSSDTKGPSPQPPGPEQDLRVRRILNLGFVLMLFQVALAVHFPRDGAHRSSMLEPALVLKAQLVIGCIFSCLVGVVAPMISRFYDLDEKQRFLVRYMCCATGPFLGVLLAAAGGGTLMCDLLSGLGLLLVLVA